MVLSLILPAALMLQGGSISIGAGSKPSQDSAKLRGGTVAAIQEEFRSDTSRRRRPVRRIPVTAEHLATAFRDSPAKSLLERARVARLIQDSALTSYDAKAYARMSVGMGVKLLGRERLAFRHEDASRVRWQRGKGVWVEVTGARTVVPIASEAGASGDADLSNMAVPYYPGRENLWIGGGLARAEVNEEDLVHPIATGAEAYYTYETGDSVTMTLPDGQVITLRELKIVAREPKWNVTVGSFWFDMRSAHLVRAVYRLSTQMDILAVAKEKSERERTDTLPNGQLARPNRQRDDGPPQWLRPMISPMKADITGITVEFGLYNQRFWLPRTQSIEGYAQVSFMRVPVTFEQRFKYESVNGTDSILPVPAAVRSPVLVYRDSLRKAGVDSVVRDSLVRIARRVRAKELADARENECAKTGIRTAYRTRYEGALRVAVQVPCDSAKLANSPDLPPSIYDANDELFGAAERDELLKSLTFGLQPGWGPQLPTLEYGLAQTRYNRVEGVSTGITATSAVGQGYNASLGARGSYADRQLNAEAALWRSNGRTTLRGAVYRRLQASDDWGNPLSFGASLSSLLYARDEGAYYRSWGGEVTRAPVQAGGLEWRLFGEQQWGDSLHSRWTLFGGGNDPRFIANPMATRVTQAGAGVRIRPQWGLNPEGFRLIMDLRAEATAGDSTYGRGLFDVTMTKPIARFSAALTLSGGAAAGGLPLQRHFYLGGSQTVRGQTALTASGDAFWLARGEIGTRNTGARAVVFGDVGWAGPRAAWNKPGRPLTGVGTGFSFLDGLIRMDVARGLWPKQQWRLDLHLDAKF